MLSNKMFNIYSQCLEKADKSRLRYRHGCIATYGGKIIATGCNTCKYDKTTCTCHAEVNVIHKLYTTYCRKSQRDKILRIFKKTTLYISRVTQAGASNDSAPCVDCLNVIKTYKIKKIIFCMDSVYYSINPNTYKNPKPSEGHNYVSQETLARNSS
jgi:tRNA(Arg) A34 adenosine deaminase TadA